MIRTELRVSLAICCFVQPILGRFDEMKKFLTLVSVVAVAGAVSTASAIDRTGNFGIGYQQSFSDTNGATFGVADGSWSLKYGFASNLTGQFIFGFDKFTNNSGNSKMHFAGGVLYDIVENENSDFYLGLRVGYELDDNPAPAGDLSSLRVNIPIGFEWSFSGLPEVAISAEAGMTWDYMIDASAHHFGTAGGLGGNLGLGLHYYF
jgi:hypothetical protein